MESGITSPEGVLLLLFAVLLDIIGFILFVLGTWFSIDDYGILDIIGGVVIGGWMLIRYSSIRSKGAKSTEKETEAQEKPDIGKQKIKEGVQKAGVKLKGNATNNATKQIEKKALKRFGITAIAELVPFVGGLLPMWTILVWKELNSQPI